MKKFVVVSFAIKGHQSLEALRNSLDRFDIPHDLVVLDDRKSKSFVFSQALFMQLMLAKHSVPIIWMNPDSEITRPPIQFNVQSTLMAIYSNDIRTKIDTGVIYMKNHPGTQSLLDMWIENNKNNPETWESENLRAAVFQWHKKFLGQVGMIPETYSPATPNIINRIIKHWEGYGQPHPIV